MPEVEKSSKMTKTGLTLGPVLFNWSPDRLRDFYARIADEAEVDRVHLGEVVCGKIENAKSRFQIGLDWVDMEAEDVRSYTALVSSVADDFMIDRELWKTMKVELDETPSPSM